MTSPPTDTALARQQQALAGEHAAVYAYGVVGARVAGTDRSRARAALDAHLARRDALSASVTVAGGEPVAAEPAYALPRPVRTADDAVLLAVVVEERVAATYADVVTTSDAELRRLAAAAMRDAAVRAALWRGGSVPFPGLTERSTG